MSGISRLKGAVLGRKSRALNSLTPSAATWMALRYSVPPKLERWL
jgi:hypothetical protein